MTPETSDGERFEYDGWFTRFMRARRNELASLVLAAVGLFIVVSALTFDPLDPSLNASSSGAPRNAFGHLGAIAADLALQWLGWAGVALGGMLFAWGVTLFVRGPRRRGPKIVTLRLIAALLALSGLAMAASSLPVPKTWPFSAGLGGAIGDLMYDEVVRWLTAAHLPAAHAVGGVVGLVFAMLGIFGGYGITPRDITDAAETGRRLMHKSARAVRHLAERYTTGLEEEVVRLQPIEAARQLPGPEPADMGAAAGAAAAASVASTAGRAAPRMAPAPAPRAPPPPPPRREAKRKPGKEPVQGKLFGDDGAGFRLPPLALLAAAAPRQAASDAYDLDERSAQLESVLLDFGVKGEVQGAHPGPVVTLFEFEPAPGVRSARVIGLSDDIARSMAAQSARVAIVPGRNVIGIELPNRVREKVFLFSLLDSSAYQDHRAALPLALGETIGGQPFVADLARMPHLLIAGTTGSGKSVGINTMILSLLYRLTPDQCKFIMIDPKMLELSMYDGIPHLLAPVVIDKNEAVAALKWTVREMEERYRRMAALGVRNIASHNRRIEEARAKGERPERASHGGFDAAGQPQIDVETVDAATMPYIVVVIDEMAELMAAAGRDIETAVQRLAQMARAAGIHLIMATQRPSVDVITGTIKANFPTRISYQVSSKIDSRTIIGEQGAEQLLGQGDLLYMEAGGRLRRLHGPLVEEPEVIAIVRFLKAQGAPVYLEGVTQELEEGEDDGGDAPSPASASGRRVDPQGDELLERAVEIVARERRATTSYLQRRLQIGYNRAAMLMERLEQLGVVGPPNHANKREILIAPPPAGPGGEEHAEMSE